MDTTVLPHNQRAAATWSSAGQEYEKISKSISPAIEHCVLRLDAKPGDRVLDVATGTGWASRLLAREGAQVTGTDIAEDLLSAARERAQRERMQIEYTIGDAERLPFSDGEFDAVISTFGVMFASNPEAAASELARVCKPGGRIGLATWLPDSTVFKMFSVMRAYMPAPPTPAPPSPFEWGRQARVEALLGQYFDLKFEEAAFTYLDSDAEAAWTLFSNGYGPTKMLAASLDASRRADLERDFIAFHDGYRTPLGISVPRTYLITIGTRRTWAQ